MNISNSDSGLEDFGKSIVSSVKEAKTTPVPTTATSSGQGYGDPANPKYNAIAPEIMWTRLWARLRCAPSRCGCTNPAIPTSTKITPRILHTVFAILSSCEAKNTSACHSKAPHQNTRLFRNGRIVYQTREIMTIFLIQILD